MYSSTYSSYQGQGQAKRHNHLDQEGDKKNQFVNNQYSYTWPQPSCSSDGRYDMLHVSLYDFWLIEFECLHWALLRPILCFNILIENINFVGNRIIKSRNSFVTTPPPNKNHLVNLINSVVSSICAEYQFSSISLFYWSKILRKLVFTIKEVVFSLSDLLILRNSGNFDTVNPMI